MNDELLQSDVAEWAWIRDQIVPRTRLFGKPGAAANIELMWFLQRKRRTQDLETE